MIEAEKLFFQGEKPGIIAKKLGIGKRTLMRWSKKGEWKTKRAEIAEKVREELHLDIKEEQKRTLDLIHAIEARYAQELRESEELPKSTSAFLQSQKVKWDLLQPKTVTQNNFIKNEHNDNGIKVIIPKEVEALLEDARVQTNA